MNSSLIKEIKHVSKKKTFPDRSHYLSISSDHVIRLSNMFQIKGKDIEIHSLENDIIPERYVRNMRLFSLQDQIKLLKSRVCVVGLGGLGGLLIENLARTGVGTLVLIDGDCFEESNLNRQLLSTQTLLFASKANTAKKRIHEINLSVHAISCPKYLDESNAASLIQDSHVVVDCLDNLHTRFILEKASKQHGVPLISAAIAGASGHITTIFPDDEGLRSIYGDPDDIHTKGVEIQLGCISFAVSLLSSMECSEVIKVLLGRGALLRKRMLLVDLMENSLEILDLESRIPVS